MRPTTYSPAKRQQPSSARPVASAPAPSSRPLQVFAKCHSSSLAAVLAVLAVGCASSSSPTEPAPNSAQLREAVREASVAELQRRMASGELSAERLVDYYLQRIESIDRSGPELRAVLELNPEARTVAKRLDREREQGRVRGPLHGIPVLLKDNIATADRMQTTAGSLALVGSTPRRDATVAARLRAAGAVILGKTNLDEFAMG
ncbi:MAG: amidase, partial [Deltaproteobacteria bacterium]|nr:amidase [Deltaproteobacteria bacterium]